MKRRQEKTRAVKKQGCHKRQEPEREKQGGGAQDDVYVRPTIGIGLEGGADVESQDGTIGYPSRAYGLDGYGD